MLPVQAVIEWKEIYKKTTGVDLSIEDATERANRMFRFLSNITKPKRSRKLKIFEGGDKDGKKTNSKKV
ncbi:hypothetical protein A3K01_04000 [candidate division WWE3 bacterium RIFOXYD1_FULL_43_17]|uniref:Uncharacterized protein n=2 Tax=Katanobacteria TaxID=422282 RepID=A0A1F4XE08_UNCKA|nr:MAG: hypothetical protein UU55_C0004G0027 [candidate division WWE3 bacterium GW2011_GWC2_41_23]OGC79861.1 MAG: hypothetical protein A3K01_04000 [candidate division WWE3 bacterium RIFOXYD1_FULL_43_17]